MGICVFLPSKGYSLERDPYMIRSLIGKIQLEYEKSTATENNKTTSDASHFKQTYSLDTRGNLLSRYLIIYDAGATFADTNYKSSGIANFDTMDVNYYLRTTFLPKSAVPLTLYGSYDDQKISGLSIPSWHNRFIYGLNWFSRLKQFPTTTVSAERVNDKTPTTDTLTTNFRLTADKDLGPTENQIDYAYQLSDDQKSAGFSSSSGASLRNLTHLSKNTTMSIGATRNDTKNKIDSPTNPRTTDITLQGVSMSLASKPSQEFNQSHNYTYFSNKSTGTSVGSTYSGDMDYRFSDRLKSHLGLTYFENRNEAATSTTKSQTISTADNIAYNITGNLSIAESVMYSRITTNADSGSAANVGGRSNLVLLTTMSYSKRLDWATFGSSYGLGYTEDNTSLKTGGKGIQQNVAASLGGIQVIPQVGFNTSAYYSSIKNLSGNISGNSYGYSASAYNRSWRRYVTLNASYDKSAKSAWITVLDQKRETYRFTALSEYFRNTRIRANAEHTNDFNAINGFINTSKEDAGIDHQRRLFGGYLNLSVSFDHMTNRSSGIPQKVFNTIYELKYTRYLLKSMMWQAHARRTERTDQATFVNATSIENSIFLPLRSWLFSVEHAYSVTEDSQRDLRENRIMFKASRTFFRVY
ncbi:MAG: hypothetical protein HY889_03530 [Deltaproteobacteria bacterium]|nr:hypothetical protein [Deltaproteobacteria bacterium]